MKKESEVAFKRFAAAWKSLRIGVLSARDEIGRDGVFQRFEYTFELLWKMLRALLEEEGLIVAGPKECFKLAFKKGLLKDTEIYFNMIDDRNLTAHCYDQETAGQVFRRIKSEYVRAFEKVMLHIQAQKGGLHRLRESEAVYGTPKRRKLAKRSNR